MKKLAKKIRELRKQSNYNQSQLSRIIGMTPSTISDWENERSEPNVTQLIKLADIFECSIDYLVERESEDGIIVIDNEKIIKNSSPADKIYNLLSDKNKFRFLTYGQGLLDGQKG